MPAASGPSGSFSLDVLRLYASSQQRTSNQHSSNGQLANSKQSNCCCTIEDLVKETSPTTTTKDVDDCTTNLSGYTELGETASSCRHHDHDHYCTHHHNHHHNHNHHHHHPFESSFFEESSTPTFVSSERRLMRNLLLLSLTSSVTLGVVFTLLSLDRYFFGPWTFLALSAAFLIGALSVYYAQAAVTRFGPNLVLAAATCSIVVYVLVHFTSSFLLFQLAAILLATAFGPFYAAQLQFISHFTSRLVHLTASVKRYTEERSHRLLHLLLFCPSHIVGHLVFVLLSLAYGRLSISPNADQERSSLANVVSGEHPLLGNNNINNNIGNKNWTTRTTSSRLESGPPCTESLCSLDLSAVEWQWASKPTCVRAFTHQLCDNALYYIFSFSRLSSRADGLLERDQAFGGGGGIGASVRNPFSSGFNHLLLFSLLLIVLGALAVVLCLLQRTEHLQEQDPLERSFLSSSIRNVLFRTLHDHHLRLLLPMAFFVGLEQGFFIADFNKLYVSCALGVSSIGYIMLTKGIIHLGATLLVHEFVRHISRPVILLSGAICQLGVLAILALWRPNDDLPVYYVITSCWALSNAIWETLLLTNILRTFTAEEWNYALLTVYSFTSLGLGASFGVSEFVCLNFKLYFLMVALLFAVVPMKLCELRLLRLEAILGPGSASQV